MQRAAYSDSVADFLQKADDAILGALTRRSDFAVEDAQKAAWLFQISHLKALLPKVQRFGPGAIHFEYDIPRMGRRIDVLLVLGGVIFVLEYKVGDGRFAAHAIDQVVDYALDLKNFHEISHHAVIAPVLIATEAHQLPSVPVVESKSDRVLAPLQSNADGLESVLCDVLTAYPSEHIDLERWEQGRYHPTPTIIEAATALYLGHNVDELSRGDAGAVNLSQTSARLEQIISESRTARRKVICFVTGVPGAGKTLVGLNIATRHIDPESDLYSVYLSGNGPLVNILHEALARDRVAQDKREGKQTRKGAAKSQVKAFIQNVHHFRDEGLKDNLRPPVEHVALFDEAQRAWDLQMTADFMQRKKGQFLQRELRSLEPVAEDAPIIRYKLAGTEIWDRVNRCVSATMPIVFCTVVTDVVCDSVFKTLLCNVRRDLLQSFCESVAIEARGEYFGEVSLA